jgi:hypothetical protein
MRVWLSYAFVAAVVVADCRARVAWVRPGRCCLAGHCLGQDLSAPAILRRPSGRPTLNPWPASGGEALEASEGSTPPPGPYTRASRLHARRQASDHDGVAPSWSWRR